MTDASTTRLTRARRELAVVRALNDLGYTEQSVSRAYYAVFYAADAALLSLGQRRSKHGAVVAAFNQFVIKRGGFDAGVGRTLRTLFELRSEADYDIDEPLTADVTEVLDRAVRFVAAVAAWLER